MTRLLSDLLDGAHIDVGTLRIAPAPHNVRALLREIRSSYTPLFDGRGLAFRVETLEGTKPIMVDFDHDRIVQVLSNLLSNAMKFTPAEGTVTLYAKLRPSFVEFVVQDSGPGIAKDALPHVFERFWQESGELGTGLGLGLYICKTIVEAHCGRIAVESEQGLGATFRFTLPLGHG